MESSSYKSCGFIMNRISGGWYHVPAWNKLKLKQGLLIQNCLQSVYCEYY